MNQTETPAQLVTPSEVHHMRQFLARVVRTPITDIKVTGNQETDQNTDLLKLYVHQNGETIVEKLDPLKAIEIDAVLKTHPAEGAAMYDAFIADRAPLYQ